MGGAGGSAPCMAQSEGAWHSRFLTYFLNLETGASVDLPNAVQPRRVDRAVAAPAPPFQVSPL